LAFRRIPGAAIAFKKGLRKHGLDAQKVFTHEFKLEQVHWATEHGIWVAQAARDLGMAKNVLGRLVR
jgi:transposase-like protein